MKLTDLPIFKMELSEEKVAEFIGNQIIYVRQSLEKTPTKDHIPVLLIQYIERGTAKMKLIVWGIADIDEHRFEKFRNLGKEIAENGIPVKAAFFSEAWMAEAKEGETYVQPSKSPKKREVLIFTAATLEMKSYGSIYALDRDANGNIVMGDLLNDGAGMQMESNLLKEFFIGAISSLKPH